MAFEKKMAMEDQIYSFNEYLLLFKSKIIYDFLSAYYVQSWAKWFACAVVFKPLKQQEETGSLKAGEWLIPESKP